MLPYHEIEGFLKDVPEWQQDIIHELRGIILEEAPDAAEVIRWGSLMYHHAEWKGGILAAGICGIGIHEAEVVLDFIHGIFLSDPHHLLQGSRKVKRFVRVTSFEDAPWEALRELIRNGARFNPRTDVPSSYTG